MGTSVLAALTELGVAIWLDDLDRSRLDSGGLADLVRTRYVRGVTTNPSIFEKALSGKAQAYQPQLQELAAAGLGVDEAIRILTTDDVRAACDVLAETWRTSSGVDGRVSIEVDPRLANDAAATIAQARELWNIVDRPNALIKIPATEPGLAAIERTIAAGISVNVTLIFSVERYEQVIEAYFAGLETALADGLELSTIQSVASFFVSRVDTEVDARLDAIGTDLARSLRGKAAIANADLAWAAYQRSLDGSRWRALDAAGAQPQRPLWASTGVKDPAYDDTRYVIDLAVDGCVNTMPEPTLDAVADHGVFRGDTVTGTADAAAAVWAGLAEVGIDAGAVFAKLEAEGVDKFIASWEHLRQTVAKALADAGDANA